MRFARDPRFVFVAFATVFVAYALRSPAFARTWHQLALAVGFCTMFDFLFSLAYRRALLFPLSGLVSSLGVFLVTDAVHAWAFAFLSFLTIGSKYFVRFGGRHVFNPNNFAIVTASLGLNEIISPGGAMRWGGHIEWTLALIALGSVLAFRANRWLVSLSYYATFLLGAWVRSSLTGAPFQNLALVLLGPGLQLFIFFMITDPKTSPNSRFLQMAFGAAVALTDNILRFNQVRMAPFVSLFLVTAGYALVVGMLREPSNQHTPTSARAAL